MTSLPELPILDDYLNSNEDMSASDRLPSLQDDENVRSYLDEQTGSELMLTGELAQEYKRVKESYKDLINSFEQSIQRDMQITKSKNNFEKYKFRSLSDFESSVANGFLDLNDYTSKEINDLVKELNMLENRMSMRSLDEYNFKTIDEFQGAVDIGLVDLSKHDLSEINSLLNTLEDEPMTITDYNIKMYGDIKLPDIESILETNTAPKRPTSKPTNKFPGKPMYAKTGGGLPSLPSMPLNETYEPSQKRGSPNKQRQTTEQFEPVPLYEERFKTTENIEDLLDNSIFKRIAKWIKNLMHKKDS